MSGDNLDSKDASFLVLDARMPWARHVVDSLVSEGNVAVPCDTYMPDVYAHRTNSREFLLTPSPVADLEAYVNRIRRHLSAAENVWTIWGLEGGLHLEAATGDRTESNWLYLLHDKLAFAELTASLGIRTPKLVSGGDAFARPRWGRAGVRSRRLRLGEVREPGLVLTEFLDGEDLSSLTVACDGIVTAHVTYVHDSRVDDDVAVHVRAVLVDEAESIAHRLVETTRLNGFMGLDFRRRRSGELYVLECNPRPTPGVLLLEHLGRALIGASGADLVRERAHVSSKWMAETTQGWRPIDDIAFTGVATPEDRR